jgi:hypothetical protein
MTSGFKTYGYTANQIKEIPTYEPVKPNANALAANGRDIQMDMQGLKMLEESNVEHIAKLENFRKEAFMSYDDNLANQFTELQLDAMSFEQKAKQQVFANLPEQEKTDTLDLNPARIGGDEYRTVNKVSKGEDLSETELSAGFFSGLFSS